MMKEEDARFRHLERKVGLFIIAAIIGIALVFVLVGLQRGFFTKTGTDAARETEFPHGNKLIMEVVDRKVVVGTGFEPV